MENTSLRRVLRPSLLVGFVVAVVAALRPPTPRDAPAGLEQAAAPPSWFLEHLREQMQHGGRFVADNSAYVSANEPFDAYGIEWSWGVGGRSLRGRLFGLKNGAEAGDFWELRTYWHPGSGEARAVQYGGDGTFGTGKLWPLDEDGGVQLEQVFFAPDGTQRGVRHESMSLPEGGHVGGSFDRVDGEWRPRRSYTWLPDTPADAGR